ncbi:hypothetical protein T11_15596 [Trichinella zimbabwensis]|uniref:Uncharacterized protein n=1 Tax=Trichinella zimbabwensis TaxID=268475 RepID=A0A0V1HR96_9BILA|nr:hypothetical protein T11_15596 [Trichinella zimbabwensis]
MSHLKKKLVLEVYLTLHRGSSGIGSQLTATLTNDRRQNDESRVMQKCWQYDESQLSNRKAIIHSLRYFLNSTTLVE